MSLEDPFVDWGGTTSHRKALQVKSPDMVFREMMKVVK